MISSFVFTSTSGMLNNMIPFRSEYFSMSRISTDTRMLFAQSPRSFGIRSISKDIFGSFFLVFCLFHQGDRRIRPFVYFFDAFYGDFIFRFFVRHCGNQFNNLRGDMLPHPVYSPLHFKYVPLFILKVNDDPVRYCPFSAIGSNHTLGKQYRVSPEQ